MAIFRLIFKIKIFTSRLFKKFQHICIIKLIKRTMSERTVHCIKYKQDLPGLKSQPLPGELGKQIFENVSQNAWNEFIEFFKMVINEYRLDLTTPIADEVFKQKALEYFFSDELKMPEGYVPPKA